MKSTKSLHSFLEETEQTINEDVNSFYNELRKLIHSTRTYTFRKWLKKVEELIDRLD